MGYMRHHAIIVSTFSDTAADKAHERAIELGCEPSPILTSRVNAIYTFLIPPDGSKESWPESDEGEERREAFLDWINLRRHEDGSTVYDWALIQYGDEDADNRILLHSDSMKALRFWEVRRPATTQETDDGTR